jgi:hypothetical protein
MDMRPLHTFLIAATLLLSPALANAQLFLYGVSESGYSEACNFVEGFQPGTREVAVVYQFATPETWGVAFGIRNTDINWTPLNISSDYITVGSFPYLQVALPACVSGPVVVATLHYYSTGGSPCGRIDFDETNGLLLRVTCDFVEQPVFGVGLQINGVYEVPPGGIDGDCFCPPVRTEQSTWGRVKSLYRD